MALTTTASFFFLELFSVQQFRKVCAASSWAYRNWKYLYNLSKHAAA